MTGQGYSMNMGTVMQGLILAALLWVGTSVNTLTSQMAVVQAQMVDVPDMKKRLSAVEQESAVRAVQINSNTARIVNLETHAK